MALTTIAGINAALPGQVFSNMKPYSSQGSGQWSSRWGNANGPPGQGATPSSGLAGDIPTAATLGSYKFVNPASGNTYLARIAVNVSMNSVKSILFAVYDRLWHNSGIDATSAIAQTINSVALTRPDALGADVEAWWEVYATMGAGTPTVTLAYTDQGGATETTGTSGALPTAMTTGGIGQFQLATGDTGVRSIQTWTASATFTSGTIDLVMRRQVALIVVPIAESFIFDALSLGLPRVYDNACLEVLCFTLGAGSSSGGLSFNLVQG